MTQQAQNPANVAAIMSNGPLVRPIRLPKLLVLVLVGLTAGCSIGPGSVPRDRFDYSAAVAESWKSQMLLNLVKIRYSDTPVFLNLGQIVSGYTVQSTFSALGNILTNQGYLPGTQTGTIGLSAQGQFTDRPTITYTPIVGESFARGFMTPIPPAALVSLTQAGAPVDLILRLMVNDVNGIHNGYGGDLQARRADPDFYLLVERLRRIQLAGAIGMQMRKVHGEEATLLTFRKKVAPEIEADIVALRKMLGLDPEAEELRVVYGALASGDKEIAILSRSILEVLIEVASFITVPEADVADHRVSPTAAPEVGPSGPVPPLIRIASSRKRPPDALVAVPYRGYWFSIDDRDIPSKRLFNFLFFINTLVETGGPGTPAVLTIPTG